MQIENTMQGQKAIALKLKVTYEINGTSVSLINIYLINLLAISR